MKKSDSKKQIKPAKLSYQDIVDNPSSDVKLECTKAYKGIYDLGYGRFHPYSYRKGDVLRRCVIFLKEKNWKIATL